MNTILESIGKAYLTLEEAAKIARLSKVTLRRAVSTRRLSACKPNGKFGKTLIRPNDLFSYLEGNRLRAIGESR